jgi:hypothetical protein
MPINVIFDAPPTPPSSTDKTNFRLRYDAFLAYIQSLGAKLITFVTQINDLESNVNAKEESAVAASNIAIALINYKGLFIQGTSSALVGESWTYAGFYYRCSINTSNNPISEPASWTPLSVGAQIHSAIAKTSLDNADEFGFWDSLTLTFKKITYAVLMYSPSFTGSPSMNGAVLSPFTGFKNYIIDGHFDFWYEATSITATFNGIGTPYASTMWKYGRANTTFTGVATISSIVGGGLKVQPTVADTSLTSGDMATILQSLEGNNIANLAGKTVTLSFTVNTNKLGDYGIGFYDGTGLAYLTPKKYTVSATGKTRYSVSFTMPSTITKDTSGRFDIHFTLAADASRAGSLFPTGATIVNLFDSTSNYFEIYEVQLEEGSVATTFQNVPTGIEEMRVMRYFEKSYDNNTYFSGARITATTTFQGAIIEFKVAKRGVPIITLYSFAGTAGTIDFQGTGSLITNLTAAADRITTHKCGIYSASTAGMTVGQAGYCIGGFKADARL